MLALSALNTLQVGRNGRSTGRRITQRRVLMGMYDNVIYKTECPDCKEPLSEFQSKDGPCALVTLEPKDVQNFYTSCPKCGVWVEFEVIAKEVEVRPKQTKPSWSDLHPEADEDGSFISPII